MHTRSARIPPGFMNATTAPPKSVGAVEASCASAMTSPSAVSWANDVVRVMSAAMEPTMRALIGPAIALYFAISAVWSGSLHVARDDHVPGRDVLHVLRLVVDREVDVRHESAERGRACDVAAAEVADVRLVRVRADHEVDLRIEAIDDRLDVAAEVVAAVDVHEAVRERRVLLAALVDQHDERPNALSSRSFLTSALTVCTSGRKSSPATPAGVTISGVPSSVSPMKAIFALSTFSISYGGRIVWLVPA